MSIGIGQIIIILLVILIVFGKLPKIFEELASGIKKVKEAVDKDQDKIEAGDKEYDLKNEKKDNK